MSLRHQIPWLVTAMIASIAAMVSGAHARLPTMTLAAATLFVLALIAVALQSNWPLWSARPAEEPGDVALAAVRRNARLMALGYLWAAAAMLIVYGFAGLRWQHAWQYGFAMTLVAAGLLAYVRELGRPDSALRSARGLSIAVQLTIVQAAAALLGLGFLVSSGKLASIRGDWAANQIFLTGGVAIIVLSAIAAYTQHRLRPPTFRARGEEISGA